MKANRQKSTRKPLINTRLQPGVGGRRASLAASAASRARGKAAKAAEHSLGRRVTGLKPGVNERKYLEITEAIYVVGYKLRLAFNDTMVRVVDFEPFLRKAMNPDIAKYRQVRNFKKFHLHHGDLMWGDFDMIFPIADLHHGNILKGEVTAPAHFVLSDAASPDKTISDKKIKAVSAVSYRKTKTLARRAK